MPTRAIPKANQQAPAERPRRNFDTLFWSAIFIGPNFAIFLLFIVVPILAAFTLSLFEWDLISEPRFVGLRNFTDILSDDRAVNSITRTAYLVVGGVIPTVVIAFLLAVLIDTKWTCRAFVPPLVLV